MAHALLIAPCVRRVRGGGWCWALAAVAVVVVRIAGAEEDGSSPGGGEGRAPLPAPSIALVRGVPFVWPAIESAPYADADAKRWRERVARGQSGRPPDDAPAGEPDSPAAFYLAADLAFLRAARAGEGFAEAAGAYEQALREASDFPDAARGWFLLGQARLALGFGPEAGAAFRELERRDPGSALVPEARLGQAAALRLRRRAGEARDLLDAVLGEAGGPLRCRALLEAAAQARAADTPRGAAAAFARLATECPDMLAVPETASGWADALVRAGEPDAARRVIADAGNLELSDDERARLHLLAGGLAADAPAARAEYGRVLGMRVAPSIAIEAKMRLALLDGRERPGPTARVLAELASETAERPLRAAILGAAADAAAQAGRFEEALALLDRAADLGREGAAQAEGRRAEILGRWIAALDAQDDAAGLAIVYAAHTTQVHAVASPADRLRIARALGRLGLHVPAARLLAATASRNDEPEIGLALAEESLAAGNLAAAQAALAGLGDLPAALAARAHTVAARAALRAGDLESAASEAAEVDDVLLRTQVASRVLAAPGGGARASALVQPMIAGRADAPLHALLVAAAAATAEGARTPAAEAYSRALDALGHDDPLAARVVRARAEVDRGR